MISSPCKTCKNQYLPKELCLESCKLLLEIQEIQLTMPMQVYSAVDSADGSRYQLSLASATMPMRE